MNARGLAPADEGLLAALRTVTTVRARATDRLAAAHDASHYTLTPQAVALPASIAEVAAILETASRHRVPASFRSGGTSLSGQGLSDGVLIDTRREFRRIEVLDGGARVRSGPGATIRAVNVRLARHGRKLGPDPASEIACTVGGVVANNSSGMACGTTANTYRTLDSAVLVLASGTVVDTASPDADERLRSAEPAVHAGLLALRDRVRDDPESVAAIRELFSIKNTMGYGVNAFLDYDRPVDILARLIVGSEGTLAWIAEATFSTVPLHTHLATGLLVFPDIAAATEAVPELVAAGFAAIELMDATSLRVAQRDPGATEDLLALRVDRHAALLVEHQQPSADGLQARLQEAPALFERLPLVAPAELSVDPVRRAALWHIRKGLFTIVAGSRPSGTSALLEDIAVPVDRLGSTCVALTRLFDAHGYDDAVIFGHAKDGNVHFLLNERFDDPRSLERYEAFTEDMVDLVLHHRGTLKAEHGTGRIMAPFVRRQYGDELYDVMVSIKRLLDPSGLLNPGVVISADEQIHMWALKTAPKVEDEVDRCVECGYCEPVCPSRDLTLTPRERIVMRREIAAADERGDASLARTLREEYEYDGVQTCAVDGMCQTACPVLINTGDLVRRLREDNSRRIANLGWGAAAKHWDAVSAVGGAALTAADAMPVALPRVATDLGRSLLGKDTIPRYTADLPPGGRRRGPVRSEAPAAVYFSSCTTTMFGPEGGDGVSRSFLRLCEMASVALVTPPGLPSFCCGTPWKSKGLTDGYATMQRKVVEALTAATDGGRLPVVCDASSCTEGLEVLLAGAGANGIRVIDSVAFVADEVLPLLPPAERIASVTLHPTCSSTRLGINDALTRVASAAAELVEVPDDWSCCAFAGDRGMLHPELTASATAAEAREVTALNSTAHASLNRTCELGMTRATGIGYRHILEVLSETLP